MCCFCCVQYCFVDLTYWEGGNKCNKVGGFIGLFFFFLSFHYSEYESNNFFSNTVLWYCSYSFFFSFLNFFWFLFGLFLFCFIMAFCLFKLMILMYAFITSTCVFFFFFFFFLIVKWILKLIMHSAESS